MAAKVAILLDGGFVRWKLRQRLRRPPHADDVVALCANLLAHPKTRHYELYRTFYYDARPFTEALENPISRVRIHFGRTDVARRMTQFLDQIEMRENFALRRGELLHQGWKLTRNAERSLDGGRTVGIEDIEPNFKQKGVDQRIGLDVAWIAMKRLVEAAILVTGDSDFVPTMKLARREGVKIILFAFDQATVRDLKAHADVVIANGEIMIA